VRPTRSRLPQTDGDVTYVVVSKLQETSAKDLRKLLEMISPHVNRNDWLRVGNFLKLQTHLDGFELWSEYIVVSSYLKIQLQPYCTSTKGEVMHPSLISGRGDSRIPKKIWTIFFILNRGKRSCHVSIFERSCCIAGERAQLTRRQDLDRPSSAQ
jgi:hypothetical protein